MNKPDYDPNVADRDAYGNVTAKQTVCEGCPAEGSIDCPCSLHK